MELVDHTPRDPAEAVALDEALLASVVRGSRAGALRIWVNMPSIVIGYSQAPCEEVECGEASRLGIPIIRRVSGGGSVYHDLGNINVSIIMPSKGLKPLDEVYSEATSIILGALSRLGVRAWVENHSDVVVKGYKVSGTAAALKHRAYLVHSTLLVASNIELLRKLLRPRLDRVARGEVTPAKYNPNNLRDLEGVSMGEAIEALKAELEDRFGYLEKGPPTGEELEEASRIARKRLIPPPAHFQF